MMFTLSAVLMGLPVHSTGRGGLRLHAASYSMTK